MDADGAVVGDEGAGPDRSDGGQGQAGHKGGGDVVAVDARGAGVVEVGVGHGGGVKSAVGVHQRLRQARQTTAPRRRSDAFGGVVGTGGAPVELGVFHKIEVAAPQR